jgi:predicted ATPase/DNA-binding winged helix-turn-helix (wHTH) protein
MVRLSDPPAIIEFGHLSILPHRRQLLADGRPIRLGGRAFDLLLALIEAPGAVVGKDELLRRIWPGRIVEENRLQNEIWALRKAFGADRDLIRTVSGRGYQFAGEIRELGAGLSARQVPAPLAVPAAPRPATNLSESISELIGREAALSEVTDLVTTHRLVTLTGEGGIGKTRLGLQVARHLLAEFADGVWVTELAPLSDHALVPVAVATALGLELTGGAISPERVANMLGAKRLLLVLDNCEHVVAAATEIAETLLRCNSTMRVLATSREPLRAEGECLYRVPPLAVPAQGIEDVEEVLRHGAVRLFVARARATDPHFCPDGPSAAAAAAICRRLDGLPLAIEFAAARAATLGIQQVAIGLRDRFALLTSGRRTALPRHQTLRATFDWSYELLPATERSLLRRLAIFSGGFTLDAAAAVMKGTGLDSLAVLDGIANLASKSLITLDKSEVASRWYLLETIRAYALEKLIRDDHANAAARHHAAYFRDLFAPLASGSKIRLSNEDLTRRTREIDNVRAALDWSFSPAGDKAIGIDLTAAYAPAWLHLSLTSECRERCERALLSLELDTTPNLWLRMRMQIALGIALNATMGPSEQARTTLTEALEVADILDDFDAQAWALGALSAVYVYQGEYGKARTAVERLRQVAHQIGDPTIVAVADRRMGNTLLSLGKPREAQQCFESTLRTLVAPEDQRSAFFYHSDYRAMARAMLARALWLQGFAERAHNEAKASLDELGATDHQLSICRVLNFGICRIATMTGDFVTADRAIARLIEVATRLNASFWQMAGASWKESCWSSAVSLRKACGRCAVRSRRAVEPGGASPSPSSRGRSRRRLPD